MLSNNTFLETKIERLLDGLIFIEKGLGVHVQCMLKISKVYTLAEILSKLFVKKTKENRRPSWFDNLPVGANLIFIKIYYAITASTTYTFTFGKC